jgi:hypothetical protein
MSKILSFLVELVAFAIMTKVKKTGLPGVTFAKKSS